MDKLRKISSRESTRLKKQFETKEGGLRARDAVENMRNELKRSKIVHNKEEM